MEYQVTDRFAAVSKPVDTSSTPAVKRDSSSLAVLDRFMSSWSKLVGDPVISKWIVIALGISVFLNGYLLKGIASGSAPSSAAVEIAARILLESTGTNIAHDEEKTRKKETLTDAAALEKMRAWKVNGTSGADLQPWSSEDAQAMTRKHNRALSRAQEEASREVPSLIKVLPKHTPNGVPTAMVAPTLNGSNGSADDEEEEKTEDDGEDEDDESEDSHPILIRTKSRKSTLTPANSIYPTSATSTSSTTPVVASSLGLTGVPTFTVSSSAGISSNSAVVASPVRSIRLSPSTINLLPRDQSIPDEPRSLAICTKIFDGGVGASLLNDEEIIMLVKNSVIAAYALEKVLGDLERSVFIRRALICAYIFPILVFKHAVS